MEGTTLMAKKEKTPQEIFAEQFVSELQPKTIEDVENGLKSIFGTILESILKGELSAHLGYESNDHNPKDTTNRRNGSTKKTLKSSAGEIPIKSPRDRDGTFNSQLIPKRQTDISGIEQKVLAMYGKGMSQRDISDIIEDIYGFRLSAQQVSIITDSVLEELTKWQERALKRCMHFCSLIVSMSAYAPNSKQKNMLSTASLRTTWMAARTSSVSGWMNPRTSINGCRFLTNSNGVVLKMLHLSLWMVFQDLRKVPKPSSLRPSYSAVLYIW